MRVVWSNPEIPMDVSYCCPAPSGKKVSPAKIPPTWYSPPGTVTPTVSCAVTPPIKFVF